MYKTKRERKAARWERRSNAVYQAPLARHKYAGHLWFGQLVAAHGSWLADLMATDATRVPHEFSQDYSVGMVVLWAETNYTHEWQVAAGGAV